MTPAKYDDVLVPFLTLMRKELHANAGKGDRPGWLAMSPGDALLEVYYHLAKLQKAVKHNDGPAIQEFSADVANMAMMVLDICGGLAWVEQTPAAVCNCGPECRDEGPPTCRYTVPATGVAVECVAGAGECGDPAKCRQVGHCRERAARLDGVALPAEASRDGQ